MKRFTALFLSLILIVSLFIPFRLSSAESQNATVLYKVNYTGSDDINRQNVEVLVHDEHGTRGYYQPMSHLSTYSSATFDRSLGFDLEFRWHKSESTITYRETVFLNTLEDLVLLNINISNSGIEYQIDNPDTDITLMHENESYQVAMVFSGNSIARTNKIIKSGPYKVVFTKRYQEDEKQVLEVLVHDYVATAGVTATETVNITSTHSTVTQINKADLMLNADQLLLYDVGIEDMSSVDELRTNISLSSFNRQLQMYNGEVFYDMLAPNLQIDFSTLDMSYISDELRNDFMTQSSLSILDESSNPLVLRYVRSNISNYSLNTLEGNTIKSGTLNGNISLGGLEGDYVLIIDFIEIGLTLETPIKVIAENHGGSDGGGSNGGGNQESFLKNYEISVKDLSGNPIEKAYVGYDTHEKQIFVFVPQNTQGHLVITGVNEDDTKTEPLSFNIDNSELPHHIYDPETSAFNFGQTHRGYGDMLFGQVENGPNVMLTIYKGKLGLMEVLDVDGEPHNGMINYNISFETMLGGTQGSNSNTTIRNGILAVPIQDGLLSLNYAYAILSPDVMMGQKVQANTPWIDLTEKLEDNQDVFYDLGTVQFQPVAYTGSLYYSDNETPLERTLVYAYPQIKPEVEGVRFIMMTLGRVNQNNIENLFYLAPLGDQFTETFVVENSDFHGGTTPIRATINLSDENGVFSLPSDQLSVRMVDPDGNLLVDQNGYDKDVYMQINDGATNSVFLGGGSTFKTGGLTEGDKVSLWMYLDMGDFDYARLHDSRQVTFTYTETPGNYEAVDGEGEIVSYVVDEYGMTHIDLKARHTQFYATVYQGVTPVASNVHARLYDQNGELVAAGMAHTGQFVGEGILSLGASKDLVGTYTLTLLDPSDTVEYYGKSYTITLPQTEDMIIHMPESKVFGKLTLSPSDAAQYGNSLNRVYINIFDNTGRFVKNVSVRNDGMFTAGDLAEGKYYAKAFISPKSNIAHLYNSSKMQIFEVNNLLSKMTFDIPMYKTMASGTVIDSNGLPAQNVWVRVYNAEKIEIESVLSNEMGHYFIPTLPDGTYYLKAFGLNGQFDSKMIRIDVNLSTVQGTLDLQFSDVNLSGTVRGDDHATLSNVELLVYDAEMNIVTTATTDTEGNYAIGGLDEGTFKLIARPEASSSYVVSDLINITVDNNPTFLDITLYNATFIGTVKKPNGEIHDSAWVHVYENGIYLKTTAVDQMGQFKLYVDPSSSNITIFASCKAEFYMASEEVVISPSTENVELTLRQSIGIRGVLKYNGDVLSKNKFIVYDSEGNAIYQTTSNALGEFSLINLSYGNYKLVVPMSGYYLIGDLAFTEAGQSIGEIILTRGE